MTPVIHRPSQNRIGFTFVTPRRRKETKNKIKRAELRTRLIEIRDAIDALYAPED
jgi:hypothetical protein